MNKEEALKALQKRKENQPKHIDNASLYAGSPMYFYCEICGHLSDKVSESYTLPVKRYCKDCLELIENKWI